MSEVPLHGHGRALSISLHSEPRRGAVYSERGTPCMTTIGP
jgi:hypothetical protein